jgi:serine/threonine protein kinase
MPSTTVIGPLWAAATLGGAAVLAMEIHASMHGGPWAVAQLLRLQLAGIMAALGIGALMLAILRGRLGTEGPIASYDVGQVLGHGAFGLVVAATLKQTEPDAEKERRAAEKTKRGHLVHHDSQQFAIKYLNIADMDTATDGIMEATRLVRCAHPNIVGLREQFMRNRYADLGLVERLTESPHQLCLVMERCDGDLLQLIRSWAPGSEVEATWGLEPPTAEKLRILAQITAAVAHIHEVRPCPLIHRDLKPENVFIAHVSHPETKTLHLHVKIGDMGLATRDVHGSDKGFAGTGGYIAPELYREPGVSILYAVHFD